MSVLVSERTARKPHECWRCKETIRPGERYIRHAATPNDSELGNLHWWILNAHVDLFCYEEGQPR